MYRWKGPRLLNRYCTTVCCKKLCRSSNRLIYDKSAPQNIYTITGALIFDTKILFVSFLFLSHVLVIIIYYISKFILRKPFWNRTLRYHRNGTLKSFSRLLPFSGRCHIPNVLRSYRITTSYNRDKIHIIGKVWVSRFHIWWSFCDKSNSGREIDTFVTEKCIQNNSMGFEWHPVAVYGITPKQNCIVTSIFDISTSNLKHNLYGFNFMPNLD